MTTTVNSPVITIITIITIIITTTSQTRLTATSCPREQSGRGTDLAFCGGDDWPPPLRGSIPLSRQGPG